MAACEVGLGQFLVLVPSINQGPGLLLLPLSLSVSSIKWDGWSPSPLLRVNDSTGRKSTGKFRESAGVFDSSAVFGNAGVI